MNASQIFEKLKSCFLKNYCYWTNFLRGCQLRKIPYFFDPPEKLFCFFKTNVLLLKFTQVMYNVENDICKECNLGWSDKKIALCHSYHYN